MPYVFDVTAAADKGSVEARVEASAFEAARPLARDLLECLADSMNAVSAREIRALSGFDADQIVEELEQMTSDGWVSPPEDGLYEMTALGEVELNKLRAYSKAARLSPPMSREDDIRFLRRALKRATEAHQSSGDFSANSEICLKPGSIRPSGDPETLRHSDGDIEFRDRLTAIIREAGKIGAEDLLAAAMQQLEQLDRSFN